MGFTRGQDPNEVLGIGLDGLLKKLGGKIIGPDDFIEGILIKDVHCIPTKYEYPECLRDMQGSYYEAGIVILVVDEKFRIIKSRYPYDDKYEVGYYKDLPKVVREIHDKVKDWATWDIETSPLGMPIIKQVAPKLLAEELVNVVPMGSPRGILPIFNVKYDHRNVIKRIHKRKRPKRGS